jgi:hypothetical protein
MPAARARKAEKTGEAAVSIPSLEISQRIRLTGIKLTHQNSLSSIQTENLRPNPQLRWHLET